MLTMKVAQTSTQGDERFVVRASVDALIPTVRNKPIGQQDAPKGRHVDVVGEQSWQDQDRVTIAPFR